MAITRDSLVQFLAEKGGLDAADIGDDTKLFSSSLLDSFTIVDLILFIEGETGNRMNAGDVNLDNMDSIEAILAYVARRAG